MIGFLYDVIYLLPLSLTPVLILYKYTGRAGLVPAAYILLATGFLTLILCVMRRCRIREKIVLPGILLAVSGGFILRMDAVKRAAFLHDTIWILGVIIVCVLVFVYEIFAQKKAILRLIPVAAILVFFAVNLVKNVTPGKWIVLPAFAYILLSVCELIQKGWKKEGDTAIKAHQVMIFPYLLSVLILLSLIRMPAVRYQWTFVKKTVEKVKSGYEVMMSYLDDAGLGEHVAGVGFSEDAKILGRLGSGNYEVFRVSTDLPKDSGVYLSGESFDTFDGRNWIKTDESKIDYEMMDILETTAAVISSDPDHVSDHIKRNYVDIEYIGTRTQRVFAPVKAIPSIKGEKVLLSGGDLSFTHKKKGNYRIEFFSLNPDNEKTEEILRQRREIGKQDFERAKSLLNRKDATAYDRQDLDAYREQIYGLYGKKPKLSHEMEEFLSAKLAGAKSDIEKLDGIEEIFDQITYTKKPGELPENVTTPGDFLDHFILQTKSGYCTHYATAFVLLSRAAGIPARYVQGYCFNAQSGTFPVSSSKTHAWAQAYIEGFGWIDCDATPSRRTIIGWAVAGEGAVLNNGIKDPWPLTEEKPEESAAGGKWKLAGYLAAALLSAASFVILFILLDLLIGKRRYQKAENDGKVRILWEKNIRTLRRIGYTIREGETLSEFYKRAKEKVGGEGLRFIGIYERLLYAGQAATYEDVETFLACRKTLREVLFQKRTKRVKIALHKGS